MSGRLILWEMGKLWSLPMIPIFLLLCLGFNLFLTISVHYDNEGADYIRYVSQMTRTIGGQMGADFDAALSAQPPAPYHAILTADTQYAADTLEQCEATQIGQLYISRFAITGTAADLLHWKYTLLQQSVDRLAQQDAALSLSAASMTKPLLDHLFQRLYRGILTEGCLLAVLMALYSACCERISGTSLTVYASKTGRTIQRSKLLASMLSALSAYLLLAGCSLAVFAELWQLGPIWQANMASQFNYTTLPSSQLPFITWGSFTIAHYLAAVVTLGAVVVVIFHLLGFAIGLLITDAYKGFLIFFLAAALHFQSVMIAGDARFWLLYQLSQWNPIGLWWLQPLWFTEMGINAILPWQECWLALLCFLLSLGLLRLSYHCFSRKEIT